jgi:hypothetical protein
MTQKGAPASLLASHQRDRRNHDGGIKPKPPARVNEDIKILLYPHKILYLLATLKIAGTTALWRCPELVAAISKMYMRLAYD